MYTTREHNLLPHEEILKVVSEYEIFMHFFPFQIGKSYKSPFRKESSPSFGIFKKGDKWLYKDLGNGEKGDCFDLVQKLYSLSYYETCCLIASRMGLKLFKCPEGVISSSYIKQALNEPKMRPKAKIDVVEKEWTENELNYWLKYGITRETLDLFNVKSCCKVFINNEIWRLSTKESPIFSFYNKRSGNIKVYLPLSKYKTSKWRTNENNSQGFFGYDQLPKEGELVIIQKAAKEVMCLYEMGYSSIATTAEGHSINSEFIKHLKKRFKRIVVMYDNDNSGIINAERISQKENIEAIFAPECKNISDYYEKYGKEKTEKLLKELL